MLGKKPFILVRICWILVTPGALLASILTDSNFLMNIRYFFDGRRYFCSVKLLKMQRQCSWWKAPRAQSKIHRVFLHAGSHHIQICDVWGSDSPGLRVLWLDPGPGMDDGVFHNVLDSSHGSGRNISAVEKRWGTLRRRSVVQKLHLNSPLSCWNNSFEIFGNYAKSWISALSI